jgi:hypothetical protein
LHTRLIKAFLCGECSPELHREVLLTSVGAAYVIGKRKKMNEE